MVKVLICDSSSKKPGHYKTKYQKNRDDDRRLLNSSA